MTYISGMGIAAPQNKFTQSVLGDFMVGAMYSDETTSRKIRAVFRASGIKHRCSVLSDYGKSADFDVYPNEETAAYPSTAVRMKIYQQHALPLSVGAVRDLELNIGNIKMESITHLIVISCTGMYAPGLDIDLIKELGLNTQTSRICINFMGCYAAFNGIKTADLICRGNVDARVLIVCTELCSIHFQPEMNDDNILANALFADGAAALLIEAKSASKKRLRIENFHNDLALNGESDMAWTIDDFGFRMRLSSYVPRILQQRIASFRNALLEKSDVTVEEVKYYAIHPGGKRILEAIEEELCLSREDNRFAYQVLENYGNMSSPTVVFVLKEIMDQLKSADNRSLIWSAAFGPGLTLESMLTRIEYDG